MTLETFGLLLLLLPLAALSGWYVGFRHRSPQESETLNPEYLKGLSYLVDEDADKAIEVFVKLLQVDNNTVETHLALGNLFRRQGEVDRALKIHQNLIARPNLEAIHRNQASYELGSDYLRAGVLDRAEQMFLGLAEKGIFLEKTLPGLVSIYEQERDWEKAIEVSRKLESVQGHSLRPITAQYYCEMAEDARRSGEPATRYRELLRLALNEHRECIRVSLLEGAFEEKAGNIQAAIRAYQRVLTQDADFASEILGPLERCYQSQGDLDTWQKELETIIQKHDSIQARIALAKVLAGSGKHKSAIDYLASSLQKHPNWLGFYHLLELAQSAFDEGLSGPLEGVRGTLKHMISVSGLYLCSSCGYEGRTLYWQCPRCKHWNAMTPLKDIVPMPSDRTYVH